MNSRHCWLLLLAACTGTSQTPISAPISAPAPLSCPVCPEPECEEAVCPATPCPVCPPPVAPPVASDWHCFHVPGRKTDGIDMCWASADACEELRVFVEKEEATTPSACTTRPTAYCFGMAYRNILHKHCAPTAQGCERARKVLRKNPPAERTRLGTCRLSRNIDPLLDAADASGAASQ